MSFIQGKAVLVLGECRASQAGKPLAERFWARAFYKALEEATRKQNKIIQEVAEFLARLAGPIFQGYASRVGEL